MGQVYIIIVVKKMNASIKIVTKMMELLCSSTEDYRHRSIVENIPNRPGSSVIGDQTMYEVRIDSGKQKCDCICDELLELGLELWDELAKIRVVCSSDFDKYDVRVSLVCALKCICRDDKHVDRRMKRLKSEDRLDDDVLGLRQLVNAISCTGSFTDRRGHCSGIARWVMYIRTMLETDILDPLNNILRR